MLSVTLRVFLPLFILISCCSAQTFKTPFELSDSSNTSSYLQANTFYKSLAKKYPKKASFFTIGNSDGGHPIYVFNIKGKTKNDLGVLINNAIHPGEPEGVDASMMLARDMLLSKEKPRNYNLYFIVMYNVDGTLNRNTFSRASQNGPTENGFRATSRNLDLNRDFIKMDSRNTRAFVSFFHTINPIILIDNHTSNGADYQYTLTYFSTHESKLLPALNELRKLMKPGLEACLNQKNFGTCPYVETRTETPDSGIVAFFETGRYATGFASIHNCLGYTVETHMLKPFNRRVMATYYFMEQLLAQFNIVSSAPNLLKTIAASTRGDRKKTYATQWKEEEGTTDSILFKGYEASHINSTWGKHKRLFYDRSKPYERIIPYYNRYKAIDSFTLPVAFIIPQAWHEVIERLQLNKVRLQRLEKDTIFTVKARYILEYKTVEKPYEGRYLHYGTQTRDTILRYRFYKGDYWIPCNQTTNRFLAETLDPKAPDSYFNWNFFDGILMQKEWYSSYVFEDLIPELLQNDPKLKREVEQMLKSPDAAKNGGKIVNYIFTHSAWHEKTHNLYPVFGVE